MKTGADRINPAMKGNAFAKMGLLCLTLLFLPPAWCEGRSVLPEEQLVRAIMTLARPILTDEASFGFSVEAWIKPRPVGMRVDETPAGGGEPASEIRLDIARLGSETWGLALTSPWRNVLLRRDAADTWLGADKAGVVFHGQGALSAQVRPDAGDHEHQGDHLAPTGLLGRLVTWDTSLAAVLALVGPGTLEQGVRGLLLPRLRLEEQQAVGSLTELIWSIRGGGTLALTLDPEPRVRFDVGSGTPVLKGVRGFEIRGRQISPRRFQVPDEWQRKIVPRADLERLVFRGLKRILSITLPGPGIESLPAVAAVPHGDLTHHDGHAVVRLWGAPEQMGRAHGALLGPQIRLMIDSTLFVVGLVTTIEKGEWFFEVLEDCWRRVHPHIPDRHVAELAAIASACPDVSWQEIRLASIFPEYFHCSGFAVFGRAVPDGTLYHGRVLDYMTEIGLQQAAVTFVMVPDEKFAFINPGFAGFHGSVTGMNDRQIALGEMGGGGRFKWDGAPMTTLMRRALEECETLEQVKRLWLEAPRTCEYYYVFSDGKIPAAVAVKATPEAVEFLGPGESHPLLGEGIADAVVLSAGKRLALLRERVTAGHGRIDEQAAIRLMDRPVSMKSNLHNALFIPQRLEIWVAVAGTDQPAAERPYVKFSLAEFLRTIPR
jgi:hypothetical protein